MTYEPNWKAKQQTWSRLKEAARKNRRTPTQAEALLWSHLRASRLMGLKFRRQPAIGPYIVDFYCPSANLVIEMDGPIDDRQSDQDAERTHFLESMHLRVIRFANQQVMAGTNDVLAAICDSSVSKARLNRNCSNGAQERSSPVQRSAPLRRDGEGLGERFPLLAPTDTADHL